MEKPDQPKLTGATEEPAPKEEPKAQAAQPDPQPAWTPTPAPSKTTGFFKSLGTWLMILVMLGLSGAVLYLMSDLNRRTYKLAQVGDTMVVQKGRFMPTGFENYQPEETRLGQAYAPIQIPQGERVPGGQLFEDRTDLDRAMFSILAAWARDQLGSDDLTVASQAASYIERCVLLPGVSEEQRRDIAVLRADLSFRKGQNLLTGIIHQLEAAAAQFKEAIEQGTSFQGQAEESLKQVQSRIDVLKGEAAKEATPEPEAKETDTADEAEPVEDSAKEPQDEAETNPSVPEVKEPVKPAKKEKAQDVEL